MSGLESIFRKLGGIGTGLAIGLLHLTRAWGQVSLLLEAPIAKQPLLMPLIITVNSKEMLCFLDTGAGVSMITKRCALSSLAKASNLKYNLTGVNGQSIQSPGYEIDTFVVGRRIIHKHPLAEMPPMALAALTGVDSCGIVGIRSLMQSIVELDHDAAKLRIWDALPEKAKALPKAPIHLSDIPLLNLELEGRQGEWAIDTGNDDCVTMASAMFDTLITDGVILEKPGGGKAVGVDIVRPTRKGWFLKGRLLGKDLRGMEVSQTDGTPTLGLIFWFAFHVFIDLIDNQLRYELREHPPVPLSIQHMLGAVLIYDQTGAVVYRLRPGGGAMEAAGIAEGDKITEIGSLKRPRLSLFNLIELCATRAGKPLTIKGIRSKDGSTSKRSYSLGR